MNRWIKVILYGSLLTGMMVRAALPPTEILDQVTFGKRPSEEKHQVEANLAPLIKGGVDESARMVQVEGGLRFNLKCDPVKPNLVTLRLWGGDVKQEVETLSGNLLKMAAEEVRITVDGKELKSPCDDKLSDRPLFPGRFVYRTVALPLESTLGKEELSLLIKPAGSSGGGYASVGGPAAKKVAAGACSRGIYAAYLHTENVFVPSPDATFGAVHENGDQTLAFPAPEAKPLNLVAMRENLVRAVDEAVEELMRRQLFGPTYEAARDELGIPNKIDGLFHWTGMESLVDGGRNKKLKPQSDDWLVPVTGSASGRPHASAGHLYMAMYREPGSRFYQDEEMVERTIALLDGYCRYQGADGGWEIGGGTPGWVGGPNRSRANGGLPGYFAGGLAGSFLGVLPELEKNPAWFAEKIDNNGDGQKGITRKKAYIQVFRDWIWKDYPRLSMRTGCANQDMHTALAAWRVNECLKILSPKDAFPDSFFKSAFRMVMGIMPREADFEEFVLNITEQVDRGGAGDQVLISPGGITMEWGFAPGYGQMQGAFAEMCAITEDPLLVGQYERFLGAIEHFIIPWNENGSCKWMVESAIGSRNTQTPLRPAYWGDFVYAANKLNNPIAQRILRFGLEQTDNFAEVSHGKQDRMHLTSEALRTLATLEKIDAFQALWIAEPTDYRLPAERSGPYLWTDPTSSARLLDPIMIKEGDRELLYIQWNLYQLINDRYLCYGQTHTVEHNDFVQGQYGPFYVAINRAKTGGDDVNRAGGPRLFVPPVGMKSATDRLSGKAVDLSRPSAMGKGTAYIFDLRDAAPELSAVSEAKVEFVSSSIDEAANQMQWSWKVTASETGLTVKDLLILTLPQSLQAKQVMQSYVAGGDVLAATGSFTTAQKMPATIATVNVESGILAVNGLQAATGKVMRIDITGQIPSFANYESWSFDCSGGEAPARRAAFVEVSNQDRLQWHVRNAAEEKAFPDSTAQRLHNEMSFAHSFRGTVRSIAFDYEGKGGNRLPIELVDESGNVLWSSREEKAPAQRVVLEKLRVTGSLTFRVRVENDHVYAGFFHSVGNVQLGKK